MLHVIITAKDGWPTSFFKCGYIKPHGEEADETHNLLFLWFATICCNQLPSSFRLLPEDITDAGIFLSLRVLKGAPTLRSDCHIHWTWHESMQNLPTRRNAHIKTCELPVHVILPIEYTEVAMLLHSHVIREPMNLMAHIPL